MALTDGEQLLVGIGSYTAEGDGHGSGLSLYSFDTGTGLLREQGQLAMPSPSWLEWHPTLPVLYAANEIAEGTITAVSVSPDGPELIGSWPTDGVDPCHIAIAPDGTQLFAANYGGGSVAVFDLVADGALSSMRQLLRHRGSGPDPDRQEGPHAHMVVLDDAGTLATVVDLGTDEIRSYQRSADGRLLPSTVSVLDPGTGPRQLHRSPTGKNAYVVGELAKSLITVEETAPGAFAVIDSTPASEQPGRNLPAQFALSEDGRHGYLSNRLPNTISVFSLAGQTPRHVAEYPAGQGWPRHCAVLDQWLIAANQHSDELIVFAITSDGARLREERRYPVASPTCVAVQPRGGRPANRA